ncbi:MAG TPA: metalloregulator ArsR/SmtB family transcription factor [Cytophagales bacterium]|nr:metalloregulator ArsR/SmtB family transcription factor [Cytophagales bacterium]
MRIKKFSISFGAQVFKAFSDESRVRILNLLFHNHEMCIADIWHILNFTQTKTSRHLSYLKNSGLVSYKKVDQWTFYYIKDEVIDMVTQIFKFIDKDPKLQKDLETYRVLYSNRELAVYNLKAKKLL